MADPGYRATSDPHPNAKFVQLVGIEHEHSGYSDGDPATRPEDYFRAARTGHNRSDDGKHDTGVKTDFLFSSDHSENVALPISTAAVCIEPTTGPVPCGHFTETDAYWKWPASLRQAREATDSSFTAMRGLEWTNDYYNHLGVFFSTNSVNAKIDGSYTSMEFFWNWLRRPVAQGGGADALDVFNHPGHEPALTPFDEGTVANDVLARFPGGGDWNDVAYVPDVDRNVVAMEIDGGDDIEWYVRALTKGWHIGAVSHEDEHQREWSSTTRGKTLLLTHGRGPKDLYWAMSQQRTVAVEHDLIGGKPGQHAIVPKILFFADASDINAPWAKLLGSTVRGAGTHRLVFDASGLPKNSRVALVSSKTAGQRKPIELGAVGSSGSLRVTRSITAPGSSEDWYFAVVCPPPAGTKCGTDQRYVAVTAPIWFRA